MLRSCAPLVDRPARAGRRPAQIGGETLSRPRAPRALPVPVPFVREPARARCGRREARRPPRGRFAPRSPPRVESKRFGSGAPPPARGSSRRCRLDRSRALPRLVSLPPTSLPGGDARQGPRASRRRSVTAPRWFGLVPRAVHGRSREVDALPEERTLFRERGAPPKPGRRGRAPRRNRARIRAPRAPTRRPDRAPRATRRPGGARRIESRGRAAGRHSSGSALAACCAAASASRGDGSPWSARMRSQIIESSKRGGSRGPSRASGRWRWLFRTPPQPRRFGPGARARSRGHCRLHRSRARTRSRGDRSLPPAASSPAFILRLARFTRASTSSGSSRSACS